MYFNDMTEPYWLIQRAEDVMLAVNARNVGVTVRWGTASEYFEAVRKEGATLQVYRGDFVPYMTKGVTPEYWTGMYALQPDLKRKIFRLGELARFVEILSAAVLNEEPGKTPLNLLLHSDVLSGLGDSVLLPLYDDVAEHSTSKLLSFLEESVCTMLRSTPLPTFPQPYRPILLYNALNWEREALFQFETDNVFVEVLDTSGFPVPAQVSLDLVSLKYTVYFQVVLPALSVNVYAIIEHSEDCANCAKSSVPVDSHELTHPHGLFSLKFDQSGFVRKLAYAPIGEVPFAQGFYSVRSSKIDPFLLSPGAIPSEKSLARLHTELISFHISDGPLFSAAQSIWLYNNSTYSQTFRMLKQSSRAVIHWEITGYPLESEDIFVGFSLNSSHTEFPLYTYDGLAWRQRVYEPPLSGFDLGRNFYPVSGAVSIGNSVIFVPEYPLGVGQLDNTYLFHLQRSEMLSEDTPFSHHFQVAFDGSSPNWPRMYHESRQFDHILAITDPEEMTLTFDPAMSNDVVEAPWNRLTSSWLGFETGDMLLSSLVKNGDLYTARFTVFPRSDGNWHWQGVEILGRTYMDGVQAIPSNTVQFKVPKTSLCFSDCQQGAVVAHPGAHSASSESGRFQSYSVVIAAALDCEHEWDALRPVLVDEATSPQRGGEEPKEEEDIELPAEATTEEIAAYTPDTLQATSQEEPEPKETTEEKPAPLPHVSADFGPVEETAFLRGGEQQVGATEADIAVLEYGVMVSLGIISVGCIAIYFRSRKRRRD